MSQINPEKIINDGVITLSLFSKIQQVGIDLTISESITIPHGKSLNVLLNEIVRLPKDIFATFTHRSTYNRQGVLITGSIYDPGYEGQIGCTIYNLSGSEISITKNDRIGQMVFFKAEAASEYNGQYNKEHLKLDTPEEKEVFERRNRKIFPDNY
jgi:deoxycytidine triphosphate deaminase